MNKSKIDQTYLKLYESVHHDGSIVRVQEVPYPTCALTKGSKHQSTVRNTLTSRCSHGNWGFAGSGSLYGDCFAQDFADDVVGNNRGLLLVGFANPREENDFLAGPEFFLSIFIMSRRRSTESWLEAGRAAIRLSERETGKP